MPLFVGAGGEEGGGWGFEAEAGVGGGVEGEFFGDIAFVVADGEGGVGRDGEGEAVVLFGPGDEVF